jgi:hypothetical protein
MTEEDYKQLELLLGKLNTEIGNDKRILIIPNYVHDGYCMGIYKDTKLIEQYVGANIKSLVTKINTEMLMK